MASFHSDTFFKSFSSICLCIGSNYDIWSFSCTLSLIYCTCSHPHVCDQLLWINPALWLHRVHGRGGGMTTSRRTAEFWMISGRNSLLGKRKKIAKFLMRTFTYRSTFLYGSNTGSKSAFSSRRENRLLSISWVIHRTQSEIIYSNVNPCRDNCHPACS